MNEGRWHVRLFGAATVRIGSREFPWRIRNAAGPFWRLYRNDRDGASLTLPAPSGAEEEYPLRGGAVYLIPAGVNFHGHATAELGHFYVHFDVLGVPRAAALYGPFSRPLCLPDSPHVCAMADSLRGAFLFGGRDARDVGDERLAQEMRTLALLHEALALVLLAVPAEERARWLRPSPGQEAVRPALEHITGNLAAKLPVVELAALCCLSEDYFVRRFRECVGTTPAQYIQERRVAAAIQRLLFTEDSIERVVQETGFGSRHYFSRVFKKHTGHSPAAYRRSPSG